jgi:hypothetical protein
MELEDFRVSRGQAKLGNLGTALVFERRVRARGASSVSRRKSERSLPSARRRKIDLSEQNDRFIKEHFM